MIVKNVGHPAYLRTLLAIGICSLALAGFAAYQLHGTPRFHGTVYPDSPPAPGFTLLDHRGEELSLEEHRGRAVLLFFGFTRCPHICPLTLARLSRVVEEAGLTAEQVAILLVTVDPEHDTPARLAGFIAPFGPNVSALTGETAVVREILAEYGVYAERVAGHSGAEELAHTTQVFGIDAAGRLRVLIHPDQPLDVLDNDIRALLRTRG